MWKLFYAYVDMIDLYESLIDNPEFNSFLDRISEFSKSQVRIIESQAKKYGVINSARSFPLINNSGSSCILENEYAFKNLLISLKGVIISLTDTYLEITSEDIRSLFMNCLIKYIRFYDRFIEYGKDNNWLEIPFSIHL